MTFLIANLSSLSSLQRTDLRPTEHIANMTTKNPLHIPSAFQADQPDMTPEEKEQQYVHSVYQAIAPHFSATRYKVILNNLID